MHKQPVLLRRTGSSIPGGSITTSTTVGGETAPGSGGQVDPNMAIPIADEDPGDLAMSMSTHKRKQSGIPLDAEAIINRASVQTSLEQITDEEEGELGMSRSSSLSDMRGGQGEPQSPQSSMPDISDFFPESGGWSLKSLLTSRGVASVAMLVMTIAFVTLKSHATTKDTSSSATAVPNSSSVGKPPQQPNSKEITIGEYHAEVVGAPMEHHVHEYNKIQFYDSPDKMKPLHSKGPILADGDMGGLHLFENVCLTNNIDQYRYRPEMETCLRGLIYFTEDEDVAANPKRCVPCSNHEPLTRWDSDKNHDGSVVGHKCGMNGLHAMFASSVGDWSECIMEEENAKLMEKWGQTQSPVNVSTIHFFQESTFVLQFNAIDMEKSLFDMLLTYLPHWDKFLSGVVDENESEGGFPFNSVISHSLQGCLSHSHNWFCEVLHQMLAFGEAREIPPESDDNTLYCYRELYYNEPGYQRNLDHEGLLTKEVFGEFREMLNRKFGLPRRRTVKDRLAEEEFEVKSQAKKKGKNKEGGEDDNDDNAEANTKIIFYDNKLSEQTVWNQMESLISKARELEKFQHIKFVTVDRDLKDLSVAQQARKFNEADAIIMAHGQHMANAIFAVDGTSFVEVGCKVESLIGNPKFMGLMDGKYRAVEKCDKKGVDEDVCVKCKGDGDDLNFTMTPESFEQLIDDVVAGLEQ